MRCLGFAIKKGEIWYAVLDGDKKTNSQIIFTGKHLFRAESCDTDLMMDFYNLFDEILTQYCPDKIAYKLHLESNLKQIPYMHYSLGVLNYLCKLKMKPTASRSGKWITAAKNKKINECIQYFNTENLKNDKLAAVLVAWHEFEE